MRHCWLFYLTLWWGSLFLDIIWIFLVSFNLIKISVLPIYKYIQWRILFWNTFSSCVNVNFSIKDVFVQVKYFYVDLNDWSWRKIWLNMFSSVSSVSDELLYALFVLLVADLEQQLFSQCSRFLLKSLWNVLQKEIQTWSQVRSGSRTVGLLNRKTVSLFWLQERFFLCFLFSWWTFHTFDHSFAELLRKCIKVALNTLLL